MQITRTDERMRFKAPGRQLLYTWIIRMIIFNRRLKSSAAEI